MIVDALISIVDAQTHVVHQVSVAMMSRLLLMSGMSMMLLMLESMVDDAVDDAVKASVESTTSSWRSTREVR